MPRGFVLQPTYRIESGRPVVWVYGMLEGGRSFLIRETRQIPHFFVSQTDAERSRALGANVPEPDSGRVSLTGETLARVDLVKPQDCPPLRDRLEDAGVRCYEADVRFAYRYLIERGIRGSLEIRGASRPGEGVDEVFDDPEVLPGDWRPEPRLLSVDIETDPQARQLLSIGLYGCGAAEVLLLTSDGQSCPGPAIPFASERELLEAFVRRVAELDPDVLTGWNFIDFDLAVLLRMSQRLGLRLSLGRGREPLTLRKPSFAGGQTVANLPGRVVLDGIQLLRSSFVRLESYSLNAASQEILGQGKTITGSDRGRAILEAFRHDRERFVEYNLQDARLVCQIFDKLHLLDLTVQRSLLTGMPLDRVAASIASFDFLYLSELGRRGIVAPSVRSATEPSGPSSGGHVLEPRPGLYRNVLVFDFKSLYPSIIRTFQIDPLGYVAQPPPDADLIVAPNGAAFRRDPGILPGMLDDLFPRREAARARGDKVASQAIKILMNSFYGVLGTSACRFASPALANAITGFGRQILLRSKKRIEQYGYEVLYGDTDSLFVHSATEDPQAARTLGEKIVTDLNRELDRHVEETWRVENRLELEFETLYLRLLLPALRRGTAGARKRYAGLVEHDGGTRVVFTGLEAVRSDWTELARGVQRELYERLFSDRPVEAYVRATVAELRAGRHDELLVYRKRLRKKLDQYEASAPHVVAARKVTGRTPRTISYVITVDGAEPATERRAAIDHEHYVQRQVRAVAEPVLTLLGLSFDKVIGDDAQLDLF